MANTQRMAFEAIRAKGTEVKLYKPKVARVDQHKATINILSVGT